MVKALFFTVVNRTVGEAGSIAFLNLCYDGCSTLNVQVGVLLTGKACVRQILCGSAAANSNKRISLANLFAQLFVSFSNQILQVLRHLFVHNSLTNLSANLTQLSTVVYIQAFDEVFDFLVQTSFLKEISIGTCSSCKAIGYGYINVGSQLTQGRRLATSDCYVFSLQLVKPQQECFFFLHNKLLL